MLLILLLLRRRFASLRMYVCLMIESRLLSGAYYDDVRKCYQVPIHLKILREFVIFFTPTRSVPIFVSRATGVPVFGCFPYFKPENSQKNTYLRPAPSNLKLSTPKGRHGNAYRCRRNRAAYENAPS